MAKRVERWESDDGSIWEFQDDAERNDARCKISAEIAGLALYGKIDPDDLLEALTTGHLGALVRIFRRG